MHDADLAHERDYVAGLYARLDELRAEKRAQLAQVRRAGAVGTMQNVSERDAFAALYEDRLAQLDAVDDRLVFGRLDLDSGEAQYIGRIGLTTDDLQRLMVDWRAPEAGHFYQATAFDRQGVRRRRHLILQGREVKAIEDDVLDADMLADNDSLQGEGALLAALNSKRTGRMSDIVGTIQSEQDRIIRSSISGALVVQGGPGTGKTAVALHRAAYLLYTHRDRLKTAGVLLVGPSSSFMKYIERVLPSLGETGVVMASVGRLMPGIHAVAEPEADVAAIKGRLDMAEVVANAVANRQRIPAENRILEVDGRKLVLTPRQVRRARERARSTGKPHNEARVSFVKILLRELTEQMTELVEAGSIGNNADRSYLAEDVRSARDVRIALNLCWMPMTPEKLIGELLSRPAHPGGLHPQPQPGRARTAAPARRCSVDRGGRAAAGRGRRTARRARRGRRQGTGPAGTRPRPRPGQRQADAGQHGDRRRGRPDLRGGTRGPEPGARSPADRRRARHDGPQLGVRAHRGGRGPGTLADAVAAAGPPLPAEVLHHRGRHRPDELRGRRQFLAQRPGAHVRRPLAARGTHRELPHAVADRGSGRPDGQRGRTGCLRAEGRPRRPLGPGDRPRRAAARSSTSSWRSCRRSSDALDGGLLAVIADGELLPEATAALRAVYGRRVGTDAGSYVQDIVVISPREAKGLEFDGVVVLEPSAMLNHEHGRVGDLYVAMTRPTQRLRLIAAADVPAGIED